jgi:hypothetical protein
VQLDETKRETRIFELLLNRVHFENRGSVGLQPGNAPATRHLGPEPPDYGFQSGRGLVPNSGVAGKIFFISGHWQRVDPQKSAI